MITTPNIYTRLKSFSNDVFLAFDEVARKLMAVARRAEEAVTIAEAAGGDPFTGPFDGIEIIKTAAASAGETIIEAGISDAAGRANLQNSGTTDGEFFPRWAYTATGEQDGSEGLVTHRVYGDMNASNAVAAFVWDAYDASGDYFTGQFHRVAEWRHKGYAFAGFGLPVGGTPRNPFLHIEHGDSMGGTTEPGQNSVNGTTYLVLGPMPAASEGYYGMGIGGSNLYLCLADGAGFRLYRNGSYPVEMEAADGTWSAPALKSGGAKWTAGNGSPNGVVTGSVGDLYSRLDGGALASFYVKESGAATNTGWVAK